MDTSTIERLRTLRDNARMCLEHNDNTDTEVARLEGKIEGLEAALSTMGAAY